MKLELSYFDTETTKAPPTLVERCLYVLIRVACCWTLFAAALLFFTLDRGGAPIYSKLHFIAGAALAIAAGLFSIGLPLTYVLQRPGTDVSTTIPTGGTLSSQPATRDHRF